MNRAAADAMYSDLHEKRPFHDGTFTRWAEKRSRLFPFHYRDGVNVHVAEEDIAPGDEFTTEANASPLAGDGEHENPEHEGDAASEAEPLAGDN